MMPSSPELCADGTPSSLATGGAAKRILFVDDEPKVLEGLRRMLFTMRGEWEMTFAGGGQEALDKLATAEYDVLVTDVRMPQMSGIELLSSVVKQYPHLVRIVLSGALDQEITVRSAALAHQFLMKPCNPEILRAAVEHALKNQFLLENPALKQLISRMPALPSMPAVHSELLKLIDKPDVSAEELGQVIAQDIGMAAKVLQLSNSAAFGNLEQLNDPMDAARYLGAKVLRSLVLSLTVSSQFEKGRVRESLILEFRDHGLGVAALARRIAESMSLAKSETDNCFAGGLLHDIGKLVLASNYPSYYEVLLRRVNQGQGAISRLESEGLGTTHSEVGAYLLWLWGIPESLTEIVALHHTPPRDPAKLALPVLIVHAADALVNRRIEDIDNQSVEAAGLRDQLPAWRELSTVVA